MLIDRRIAYLFNHKLLHFENSANGCIRLLIFSANNSALNKSFSLGCALVYPFINTQGLVLSKPLQENSPIRFPPLSDNILLSAWCYFPTNGRQRVENMKILQFFNSCDIANERSARWCRAKFIPEPSPIMSGRISNILMPRITFAFYCFTVKLVVECTFGMVVILYKVIVRSIC